MIHEINHKHKTSLGFIELLNDLGFNIVHIDNTYFVFSEFIEVDGTIVEITMRGKDVTSLVENQTDTVGVDKLRQRELVDKISLMKDRRRVFSPSTPYSKYIANGS